MVTVTALALSPSFRSSSQVRVIEVIDADGLPEPPSVLPKPECDLSSVEEATIGVEGHPNIVANAEDHVKSDDLAAIASTSALKKTGGGGVGVLSTVLIGTPLQLLCWRRRYFELKAADATLAYWRSFPESKGQSPSGELSLAELDEVAVRSKTVLLHFAVSQCAREKGTKSRTQLCMRLGSTEDAERWGKLIHNAASARLSAELPADWDVHSMLRRSTASAPRCVAKVPLSESSRVALQTLIDHTYICKRTRDRRGLTEMPIRLEIVDLTCIHNVAAWIEYRSERQAIAARAVAIGDQIDPLTSPVLTATVDDDTLGEVLGALDERANEQWLFHGAPAAAVEGITDANWRLDLAGSHAGDLYGKGIYLAECSSKADEYADPNSDGICQMLLCRASLGRILVDSEKKPDENLPALCLAQYDALCGDRWTAVGTFREFILFNPRRAYPAYIVSYRRVEQKELRYVIQEATSSSLHQSYVVPYIAQVACTHHDKTTRYGVYLLLQAARDKIAPVLVAALRHKRWPVRRYCAAVIGNLCDKDFGGGGHKSCQIALGDAATLAIKLLTECLKDENSQVRREAAIALGKAVRIFDNHCDADYLDAVNSAVPILMEMALDPFIPSRVSAIAALGYFGSRTARAMPTFAQCLMDTCDDVRIATIKTLGLLGQLAEPAVPALTECLSERVSEIRFSAAVALGQIGISSAQALPALIVTLQDESDELREAAVVALGSIGICTAGVAEAVASADKDSKENVRKAAARTLCLLALSDASAVRHLVRFLKNDHADVRQTALQSFEKLGASCNEARTQSNALGVSSSTQVGDPTELKAAIAMAMPTIIDASTDSNDEVRRAAVLALGKCGAVLNEKVGDFMLIPKMKQKLGDCCAAVGCAANTALIDLGERTAPSPEEIKLLEDFTYFHIGKKRISSSDELAPGDYDLLEKMRAQGSNYRSRCPGERPRLRKVHQ